VQDFDDIALIELTLIYAYSRFLETRGPLLIWLVKHIVSEQTQTSSWGNSVRHLRQFSCPAIMQQSRLIIQALLQHVTLYRERHDQNDQGLNFCLHVFKGMGKGTIGGF
jgi:hypothetical protein